MKQNLQNLKKQAEPLYDNNMHPSIFFEVNPSPLKKVTDCLIMGSLRLELQMLQITLSDFLLGPKIQVQRSVLQVPYSFAFLNESNGLIQDFWVSFVDLGTAL